MERATTVAATIAHLAEKAFAKFELRYDEPTMSWCCRNPDDGCHRFYVYFAPGVIFMWGDIGEYAWRVGTVETLRWWLDQGGKGGDYPDYFLGKLRATDGPVKAFYVGDAYEYINDRIDEFTAYWSKQTPEAAADAAEVIAEGKKTWSDLRAKFKDNLDEQDRDERTCWYNACVEVLGDSDPPSCDGWTGHALWSWHAARTFARLHALIPVKTGAEDITVPITVPEAS